MNNYTLPADERELLVQAVEEAGERRALRVEKLTQIQNRLRWAKNDAAREAYAQPLHDAMVALASADKIERDAKDRLEQHLAESYTEKRLQWHSGEVEWLPDNPDR
jgi:hypothetical protein